MVSSNKRWTLRRRSTGSTVRGFDSREAARNYKRETGGNFVIFDNVNMEYVR